SSRRAKKRAKRTSSDSWKARSRSGGCPTTWSLQTKSRIRLQARSRSSYCASNSKTIDCRPHRLPSEILASSGVYHLSKRFADASMTFSGLMKAVPSDEATHTAIDRSFHESESRKLPDVLFMRDLGNDFLHLGVA